jgi:hypothetical protein
MWRLVLRLWSRRLALGFSAMAVLAIAGCGQDGSYQLSWQIMDATTGAVETSASGCSSHAIDTVLVIGADASGDGQQVIAPCTPGRIVESATPGTWAFQVEMLNTEGAVIGTPASVPEQPVPAGGPRTSFAVVLTAP